MKGITGHKYNTYADFQNFLFYNHQKTGEAQIKKIFYLSFPLLVAMPLETVRPVTLKGFYYSNYSRCRAWSVSSFMLMLAV